MTVNEQTINKQVIFPPSKTNKYKINYFFHYLKGD